MTSLSFPDVHITKLENSNGIRLERKLEAQSQYVHRRPALSQRALESQTLCFVLAMPLPNTLA